MALIDWPTILHRHGVDFVDAGPSTSRGNIYVRCPWCGGNESGHHLGISLSGKGWGCWKSASHRGRAPDRLLAALLGIGRDQARRILGITSPALDADSAIFGRVKSLLDSDAFQESEEKPQALALPKEFKSLIPRGQGWLFFDYLEGRGFRRSEIEYLAGHFRLRYAMRGGFRYRLIIPIKSEGRIVTWTGRSIVEGERLRYLTLTTDPERAAEKGQQAALMPITDCLLDEDNLRHGAYALVICEGPLDAMRLEIAIKHHKLDARATCLFGKQISAKQIEKLLHISRHYRRLFLMLDADASLTAIQIREAAKPIQLELATIPKRYKDPGEMPLGAIIAFMEEQLHIPRQRPPGPSLQGQRGN